MPLLHKDNCRSARIFTDVQRYSLQIFQESFSRSFWETIYCIFGHPHRVFLLTKAQSVDFLHLSKILSRKACSHHGNFCVWGILGIGHTLIHLFHSNFPEKGCSFNFERLICHIDFVLADVI